MNTYLNRHIALTQLKRWLLLGIVAAVAAVAAGCHHRADREETPQTEQVQALDADTARQLRQLNEVSDEMYKLAADGQVEQAREKLLALGEQATTIKFHGITTIEGVQALSSAIAEAVETFNAVQYSQQAGMTAAVRVRLAADALAYREGQPMWLQYYRQMNDSALGIGKAVSVGDAGGAITALDALKAQYAMIRPAVRISRPAELNVRMESVLKHMEAELRKEPFQAEQLLQGAQHVKHAVGELFGKGERAAYVPLPVEREQPLVWSLAIGSCIGLALMYAAWRMVLFERTAPGGRGRK